MVKRTKKMNFSKPILLLLLLALLVVVIVLIVKNNKNETFQGGLVFSTDQSTPPPPTLPICPQTEPVFGRCRPDDSARRQAVEQDAARSAAEIREAGGSTAAEQANLLRRWGVQVVVVPLQADMFTHVRQPSSPSPWETLPKIQIKRGDTIQIVYTPGGFLVFQKLEISNEPNIIYRTGDLHTFEEAGEYYYSYFPVTSAPVGPVKNNNLDPERRFGKLIVHNDYGDPSIERHDLVERATPVPRPSPTTTSTTPGRRIDHTLLLTMDMIQIIFTHDAFPSVELNLGETIKITGIGNNIRFDQRITGTFVLETGPNEYTNATEIKYNTDPRYNDWGPIIHTFTRPGIYHYYNIQEGNFDSSNPQMIYRYGRIYVGYKDCYDRESCRGTNSRYIKLVPRNGRNQLRTGEFKYSNLLGVTFDGINTIPKGCFFRCRQLNTLDLRGVSTIRDVAFKGTDNLTEIMIPETVTYIGIQAFYTEGNKGVKKITFEKATRRLLALFRRRVVFGSHTINPNWANNSGLVIEFNQSTGRWVIVGTSNVNQTSNF